MKYFLTIMGFLAAVNCAYASEKGNQGNNGGASSQSVSGALAIAGAAALSSSSGGQAVSYGSTNTITENQNDRIIPASSAIAPNVTTNVICPIITQGSHAVQLLIFGGSTTGVASVNGICVAYHLGQTSVVEQMACNTDKNYAKANPKCTAK